MAQEVEHKENKEMAKWNVNTALRGLLKRVMNSKGESYIVLTEIRGDISKINEKYSNTTFFLLNAEEEVIIEKPSYREFKNAVIDFSNESKS